MSHGRLLFGALLVTGYVGMTALLGLLSLQAGLNFGFFFGALAFSAWAHGVLSWRRIAGRMATGGLVAWPAGLLRGKVVEGELDGFRLRVTPIPDYLGVREIELRLEGGGLEALESLGLSMETYPLFSQKEEDPEIGAPNFDRRVFLQFPDEARGLALLTAPVRAAVHAFVLRGGTFQNGQLTLRIRGVGIHRFTSLEAGLRERLELVRELARLLAEAAADPVAALLDTAWNDPIQEVRLGAVRRLAGHFLQDPNGQEALAALKGSPCSAVRLEACCAGPSTDVDLIREIVRDSSIPAEVRTSAIRRLPEDVTGGLAPADLQLLSQLARVEGGEVLAAILQAFLRHDHLPGAELLRQSAERISKAGQLTLVRLTSRVGPEQAPWLTQFLRSRNLPAAIAAAQALGAMGDADSLATLTQVADDHMAVAPEVRRAARSAVDRLRGRLADRGGQLTVVDDGGGSVSLAEDLEGGLSDARARPPKQKA